MVAGRVHARRCRPSDHPRDARRRTCGRRHGRSPAGRGRLRDRLLVPGRAQGPGPHPHPDVGRPLRRRHHDGDRGVHPGRTRDAGDRREGAGEGSTGTRAVARRGRTAETRRRRRADPGPQDVDLRHRPAHPPVGRVGAGDDSGADGRRSRVHGGDRRARRRCRRPRGRSAGRRRGPHHVRSLSQLQGRATRVLSQPHRCRRHPARGVRRVRGAPGPERVLRARPHRRQRRRRARSARQRDPHRRCATTSSARTC